MKIPPVKGTRDFYPQEMAVHNYIIDGWKASSLRNGFEQYDGPIFEHLKMYTVKSGDEIAEQLFSFQDRGGRDLAIRPEMTPTLARMVNQRINALPRPIKWFSLPRLCRAERPQKGRLREFYQWNFDIIGIEDVLADAEIVFTAVDYLKSTGLTADDIVVKISSRRMLAEVLKAIGIADDQLDSIYALLDKKTKLPPETFQQSLAEKVPDAQKQSKITDLMNAKTIEQISDIVEMTDDAKNAINELQVLFSHLETMGIDKFCKFDISIVRGLAYYTGIVFEIYDRASELRAIGGGGRYDNLLKQFGGQAVTATGFGMGDCVLEILLAEKSLLNSDMRTPMDYYITYTDQQYQNKAIELCAKIRTAGSSANFSYKCISLGKQLKQAASQNAAKAIIIGDEIKDEKLTIKDMTAGSQEVTPLEDFLNRLSDAK